MPTESEIEAEAKRWAQSILGWTYDGWWENADPDTRLCTLAYARYTLERRERPEDVEAVAKVMVKAAFPNLAWDDAFDFTRKAMTNCAQAIIAAYGPLPAPPQITEADVLRCAAEYGAAYVRFCGTHSGSHLAGIRAALTAFLSPPPAPVDPRIAIVVAQIRAACEGMDANAQRVARDVLAALDGVKADG